MPTQRRQTIEVVPDWAQSRPSTSDMAPSTPPSSTYSRSSPSPNSKAVRFASRNSESRQLTLTEQYSLRHFEAHARQCLDCQWPYEVYRRGNRLCDYGHDLAQDVALHVYHKDGDVYSVNDKLVRVELPHDYSQVRDLLRGMKHRLHTRRTQKPIVSYDPTYPVSKRRDSVLDTTEDRRSVVVEPSSSSERSRPAPKSSDSRTKHKSKRYSTVVIQSDDYDSDSTAAAAAQRNKDKRGSLYEIDQQRRRRDDYIVEIHKPSSRSTKDSGASTRRRREDRKSGVWS